MKEQTYVCCICHKKFKGYGNNPAPVDNDLSHRCCDGCNDSIVIPARLAELYGKGK